MKPQELRLGNIINYVNYDFYNDSVFPDGTYDEVQVTVSILESILRGNDDLTQGCYSPIILTEEILLKLGFIKTSDFIFHHSKFNRLYVDIKNPIAIHLGNVNGLLVLLDYVHDLQNIFFALTGEELTLNK